MDSQIDASCPDCLCETLPEDDGTGFHALMASTVVGVVLLIIEQILAKSSCPANSISELALQSFRKVVVQKQPGPIANV